MRLRHAACIVSFAAAVFAGCAADSPDLPAEPSNDTTNESIDESADELSIRVCAGPLGLICGPNQYCNGARPGLCPSRQQTGVCAARPRACTKEYRPVCGCDGKTYGNACTAAAAGVSVDYRGECVKDGPFCGGIAGIPCPDGATCVDDPRDDCDPKNGGADCGGICVCKDALSCAAVLCPIGTQCVERGCTASCEPIDDGCGGCPVGQYCCDPLHDRCVPVGNFCAL